MLCRPAVGNLTVVLEPTWLTPMTSPSARKTTNPVGVPEALVTDGLKVTCANANAGLGLIVKLTFGAAKSGGLLRAEAVPPGLALLLKAVPVDGSTAPEKKMLLVCVPPVLKVAPSDAQP